MGFFVLNIIYVYNPASIQFKEQKLWLMQH